MSSRSGFGFTDILSQGTRNNAYFADALSTQLDVGMEVTTTAQSTIFSLHDRPTYIGGVNNRRSPEDPVWLGAIADADITLLIQPSDSNGNTGSGSTIINDCPVGNGVTFCPLYYSNSAGTRRVAKVNDFEISPGHSAQYLKVTVSVASGTGTLYRLWVGPLVYMPYQWQSGVQGPGGRRWDIDAPHTECGGPGTIVRRRAPGLLRASMPNVPNEWIQAVWYDARAFMAGNAFWHTLDTEPAGAFVREVDYCWCPSSPPEVELMPTGFSTINVDALTYAYKD